MKSIGQEDVFGDANLAEYVSCMKRLGQLFEHHNKYKYRRV